MTWARSPRAVEESQGVRHLPGNRAIGALPRPDSGRDARWFWSLRPGSRCARGQPRRSGRSGSVADPGGGARLERDGCRGRCWPRRPGHPFSAAAIHVSATPGRFRPDAAAAAWLALVLAARGADRRGLKCGRKPEARPLRGFTTGSSVILFRHPQRAMPPIPLLIIAAGLFLRLLRCSPAGMATEAMAAVGPRPARAGSAGSGSNPRP